MTTLQTRPTTRVVAGPGPRPGAAPGVSRRDPARQLRRLAHRGLLHAGHLVQALLLLHLSHHRPRPARHRDRAASWWRCRRRLRQARTDTVLLWSFLLGGAGVVASYVVVAYTSLDSLAIWDYGTSGSAKSMGELLAICVFIFVPFVAPGRHHRHALRPSARRSGQSLLRRPRGCGAGVRAGDLPDRHRSAPPPRSCWRRGHVLRGGDRARPDATRWRCPCCWC